jgi:H+/Cl- antiporter ClcA
MPFIIEVLRLAAVLAAAALLGNWFLAELRKARRQNLPWYAAYLSPPGLLILAALLVPLIYWLARQ